ncbi:MAG: molecular chaperone [Sphingopyxis sp.]|nr:molecular chaperone [Sphingopyxis sp.]
MLLWPVNPEIKADAPATALWLENAGKEPVTMQIRVYAWAQVDGKNAYAPQDEVIGTPPLFTIRAGEKQLVRLTRTTPPVDVPEASFRIVIDEIPVNDARESAGTAVKFRMRYSLPLFVHGRAMVAAKNDPATLAPQPALSWRIGTDASGRFLEIVNSGGVHARLVDAAFEHKGARQSIDFGLLGYVLPKSSARWPVGDEMTPGTLMARINGGEAQVIAPAAD